MANAVTEQTAIPIKSPSYGALIPLTISMDTVQSDFTVKAAVTGKSIGVFGGALQNNHASGAQTIIFKSGSIELFRRVVAAAGVLSFDRNGQNEVIGKTPYIATIAGQALVIRLNDATNQPVNGNIFVAVSEYWQLF